MPLWAHHKPASRLALFGASPRGDWVCLAQPPRISRRRVAGANWVCLAHPGRRLEAVGRTKNRSGLRSPASSLKLALFGAMGSGPADRRGRVDPPAVGRYMSMRARLTMICRCLLVLESLSQVFDRYYTYKTVRCQVKSPDSAHSPRKGRRLRSPPALVCVGAPARRGACPVIG